MPPAIPPPRPLYVNDGNHAMYEAQDAVQLCDVVMHNFCIPADPVKLQAWLDKTFAVPSGGAVRYKLLGDKVFLSFAEIGKLYILNRGQPPKGYTSEIDITIWVLAQREDDGLFAMRWIPAYLFVDSAPAMVNGREIWGFPKQIGQFNFSPKTPYPGAARTFSSNGYVVSPFGPESPARWAPMFDARPLPPKDSAKNAGVLGSLEALAAKAVERLTGGFMSAAGGLQAAIGAGSVTMALLKQFPYATDPTLASYQAIVETEAKINVLRGAGLTDNDYEARLISYDSHPFLAELGLSPDWQEVGQGLWVDMDFRQELGVEQWRANSL